MSSVCCHADRRKSLDASLTKAFGEGVASEKDLFNFMIVLATINNMSEMKSGPEFLCRMAVRAFRRLELE
jgi:hypothetical protein